MQPEPQDHSTLDTLAEVADLTVAEVHLMEDLGLTIVFEGGHRLMVSGETRADTIGSPWWLGTQ